MKSSELVKCLGKCLKANIVPFIQGAPGVGKSAIVRQAAEATNLEMIDVRLAQCDVTDLNGFPKLTGDKATFVPMDVFPLESDPLPEGKKGWLLFLDELNSANKSIQACAYKLILDRMVGQHKLHPNVYIIAAGNREEDGAVVNPLSTALRSRMVNVTLDVDVETWLNWAESNNVDFRVLSFIKANGVKALHDFNPDKIDQAYPCPRTWEMMDKLLKSIEPRTENDYLELFMGTIGGTAAEFLAYIEVVDELPTFDEIMNKKYKDPRGLKPGTKYLITYYTLQLLKQLKSNEECECMLDYVGKLDREYLPVFFSKALNYNVKMTSYKSFQESMREFTSWIRQ